MKGGAVQTFAGPATLGDLTASPGVEHVLVVNRTLAIGLSASDTDVGLGIPVDF